MTQAPPPPPGRIVLGANQYGKAEIRLVHVDRTTPRHEVTDLTVTSQLRGEFEACHTDGDNARVVATDTQKNTVHALAREHGCASPEEFLLVLGRHFVDTYPWVSGGRWEAESSSWGRIPVDGQPHEHAFVRRGEAVRTALVQLGSADGHPETHVIAGFTDCVVMKTTGSEFHGFPRDRFTTLAETDDRILATSMTARWRYTAEAVAGGLDFDATYAAVLALLLSTFASVHSQALQQSIFAAGRAVLEAHPEIGEIKLSCPNKHHFLVDLTPFGLDNPNQVFHAADRPYGLIEATVQREGAVVPERAWATVAGFC